MMPDPSYEYRPESSEASGDFANFNKAQEAWKSTEQYAKENPFPVILFTLILGVFIGALLSPRKRKQKDAVQAAKELLEAAYEQLAEVIPQLARTKFSK
jgi:hypothetical protein